MSRDVDMLTRAYLVYVRPLLEVNSVIWSPHYKQHIDLIERVQRRFTKRLPGYSNYIYNERLVLNYVAYAFMVLQNVVWSHQYTLKIYSKLDRLLPPEDTPVSCLNRSALSMIDHPFLHSVSLMSGINQSINHIY